MNNAELNKNIVKTPVFIYLIIGFIVLCFRFYFNFAWDLIPGVNGGYYPLQVRYVLTNGHLGFPDMPLLFYVDAFLIKFISLFGFSITDTLILNVVKIIDSISIPLLLIPLYKIMRLSNHVSMKFFDISIVSFSVLSFSPLILTSDLQKNALAIVFLFGFIAFLLYYLIKKRIFDILLAIAFLLLTGLTHFGTFIFAILFLLSSLLFIYRQKAIIPLILAIVFSGGIVAIFDLSRFNRLISFWTIAFERPALLNGMLAPPDYLNILISLFLAIYGIIILKSKSSKLEYYQKAILFSSIVCLIALSFPLLDGEYFKRLNLFLFIPQILLILQLAPDVNIRKLRGISICLFLFTLLSVLAVSGHLKEPVIDAGAYENLKELKPIIKDGNETIIIARHGLEWWTAWVLQTKVGQDKAIDNSIFEKYKNVIFVTQMDGFGNDRERTSFHEPTVPQNSRMIFSSVYFKAFKSASLKQGID